MDANIQNPFAEKYSLTLNGESSYINKDLSIVVIDDIR
jgi:hypothetical protein